MRYSNKRYRRLMRNLIKEAHMQWGAYIERTTIRRQMRSIRKLITQFHNKQNYNLWDSIGEH